MATRAFKAACTTAGTGCSSAWRSRPVRSSRRTNWDSHSSSWATAATVLSLIQGHASSPSSRSSSPGSTASGPPRSRASMRAYTRRRGHSCRWNQVSEASNCSCFSRDSRCSKARSPPSQARATAAWYRVSSWGEVRSAMATLTARSGSNLAKVARARRRVRGDMACSACWMMSSRSYASFRAASHAGLEAAIDRVRSRPQ